MSRGQHALPTRRRRAFARVALVALGIGAGVAVAGAAWSFLTSPGAGPGHVRVATLNPPTDVSANFLTVNARTVTVAWDAPSEPAGIVLDGYYVRRVQGGTTVPACGTSAAQLTTALTCDDTGVASNTYTYVVTAVFNSWTASALSDSVIVPAPRLTSLSITPSTSSPVAGTPFSATVTALDQYGDVDTSFGGTQCLSFSGALDAPNATAPNYGAGGLCALNTTVRFTKGVAGGVDAPSITLADAATTTLNVQEAGISAGGTTTLDVGPGALNTLALAPATSTPNAGSAFGVGVRAYDAFDNVDTNYDGTECVAFSGASAAPGGQLPVYPAAGGCGSGSAVTFDAGAAVGADAPSFTLDDAASVTLDATGVGTAGSGSTTFAVGPGPLSSLALSPSTTTPAAGAAFTVGLKAYDAFGNLDTDDTGNQCVAFSGALASPSDAGPTYPAPAACTAGSNVDFTQGVATGPDAPAVTLDDAVSTTLRATDVVAGAYGTSALNVGPGALNYLTLAPSTSTPTAGVAITVGLEAFDTYGNVDVNYVGDQCVNFTGAASSPSGQAPSYPASGSCASGSDLTFVAGQAADADAAPITLYDAGEPTLVATDVASGANGSSGLVVAPAPLSTFALTPDDASPTAGDAVNVALSAQDAYGNVVTSYAGNKCFTFTGALNSPNGTVPVFPSLGDCSVGSMVTFVNGQADGANAATVTLFRAHATTLTATENTSGLDGDTTLDVAPGALAGLALTAVTTDATPSLVCTGPVGSISCVSSGEGTTVGESVGASLRLADQYGNTTLNTTGSAFSIDLAVAGEGSVTPVGDAALSVPSGQTTTTAAFVLSHEDGAGNSVTLTATIDGTSMTIALTLSS